MTIMNMAEKNLVPDALIRAGIRHKVKSRLQEIRRDSAEDPDEMVKQFAAELSRMPIAVHTEDANQQHYELPAEFFRAVLGPRLKYSSGLWEPGVSGLSRAEEAMLELYVERAEIGPGQRILDLGCGWGSLSLYLAQRFPDAEITALSNSHTQRVFIQSRLKEMGLGNLHVLTGDIREFHIDLEFDRILSIEMFEHMKNYHLLLEKVAGWLGPKGKLFVHVFVHRRYPYHFDAGQEGEWMARHFFTGGVMPSLNLLPQFQEHLKLDEMWPVSGVHYEKTANAWLKNMDAAHDRLRPVFERTYGDAAGVWWGRWRIFFMACAELFGFDQGREWHVAHYRFRQANRPRVGSPGQS